MESWGSPDLVFPGAEEIQIHIDQGPRQASFPAGDCTFQPQSRVDWGTADTELAQPGTATWLVNSCCSSPGVPCMPRRPPSPLLGPQDLPTTQKWGVLYA